LVIVLQEPADRGELVCRTLDSDVQIEDPTQDSVHIRTLERQIHLRIVTGSQPARKTPRTD
jgi:hypothetical protein